MPSIKLAGGQNFRLADDQLSLQSMACKNAVLCKRSTCLGERD